MIRKFTILALILFVNLAFAQWEKVSSRNLGVEGKMAIYNGFVFAFGDSVGSVTTFLRSADNGTTWEDLSANMPDELFCLHEHNGELLGVFFGSTVGNALMVSADNGQTWTTRSTFTVDGGAVLSIYSDGAVLYALSNRDRIFRSTDNGATWTEFTVSHNTALQGLDFAAQGDLWVFVAVNVGAIISTDGGANWAPVNPDFIISETNIINGDIYGSTFGMYKLNAANEWELNVTGWPGVNPFWATGKAITGNGQAVFAYAQGLLESSVYQSDDNGASWHLVAGDFPTDGTFVLNEFLAADQNFVYCYYYPLDQAQAGIYRAPLAPTAIEDDTHGFPGSFELTQNYPNPFNPSTRISYQLPAANNVTLKVYDVLGREVQTLVNEFQSAGRHTVSFNAQHLSSGVYLYTITTGNFQASKKMLLVE